MNCGVSPFPVSVVAPARYCFDPLLDTVQPWCAGLKRAYDIVTTSYHTDLDIHIRVAVSVSVSYWYRDRCRIARCRNVLAGGRGMSCHALGFALAEQMPDAVLTRHLAFLGPSSPTRLSSSV